MVTTEVTWRFGLLGPLEVSRDGLAVVIGAAKQRVLLTTLLLAANQVVPISTLVDRLWGSSPPPGHRNTLQNHVLRLRRALGASCPVHTCQDGYLVRIEKSALDLHEFRRLVAAARTGDPVRAIGLLRQALNLWRGPALADVPSDALHREIVPVLAENRLHAVELRISAELALGHHREVVDELLQLTLAHPLREPLWAMRILALYRCGRQAEALACYRDVHRLLAHELGIDPTRELTVLHQRMLTGDPALQVTGK